MPHTINRKIGGPNVMLKIDMAKAYDRVDWKFLNWVLQSFGFLAIVYKLISKCVLDHDNGTFKNYFKAYQGLRQGNHLLPYLFILMEEVHTRLLKKNYKDGRIGKYFHPRGTPLISHLLYADNLLVFINGKKKFSP